MTSDSITGNGVTDAGTIAEELDLELEVLEEYEEEDDDEAIELVVLDLAGTTVRDDGLVEEAFELAAERTGIAATADDLESALDYVRATMGQSKIEVFRALTGSEGAAAAANEAFETAYLELVADGGIVPIPGAEDLLRKLREYDVKIALTTGFSRVTMDAILDALGWRDLVDVTLTPAEAGRGRPAPDLPLTALLRTSVSGTGAMVVVGDTSNDILSGIHAGAGLVIGVLTGAHDAETLDAAGADVILDSVADLPGLLGIG